MSYGLYANGSGPPTGTDRRGLHQRLPRRDRHDAAAAEHVDASGDDLQRQRAGALRERRPGRSAARRGLAGRRRRARSRSAATPSGANGSKAKSTKSASTTAPSAPAEITGGHERARCRTRIRPRRRRRGRCRPSGGLSSAQLSWGAATDNVGVVRYNVHRATTCRVHARRWRTGSRSRPGRATPTRSRRARYYYRVTAEDAAGNRRAGLERGVGDGR